jgi:hypothetical protein
MQGMSRLTNYTKGRRATIAASIAGAVVLAACADSTGIPKGTSSQLAFTTGAGASANAAPAALVPVTSGGHTLDLTQISFTISRAELKRASTDACPGDADDDGNDSQGNSNQGSDSCAEVKVGATTIDLPLDGSLVTLPANAIPAGTFRELDVRVSSVRLKGTFDTKPFDVTIAVNAKDEVEFATPLVVTAGTPTTITMNVSAGMWLVNADGSLVDPSTIATTPSVLAAVKNRIAASLRAFEDANHDGRDDHGDHGKDGHGG